MDFPLVDFEWSTGFDPWRLVWVTDMRTGGRFSAVLRRSVLLPNGIVEGQLWRWSKFTEADF